MHPDPLKLMKVAWDAANSAGEIIRQELAASEND
jgi:hypothetical protein